MINVLIITGRKDARARAKELFPEETCMVTYKPDVGSAVSLVERSVFDAVILMSSAASEHTLDEIRSVRRANAETPLAIVIDAAPLPWEESALSSGADIIMREPVSAAHLGNALRRITHQSAGNGQLPTAPVMATSAVMSRGALEILRDFSHILGYSLDYKLFAEQFVQKVREIVGVSRIAVYLERPPTTVNGEERSSRMSCAAAIGVPPDIIECFDLTRAGGIGARMYQAPQILLASSQTPHVLTPADQKIQREFEILGCRVAIPVSDRTRTIGVAVLGGHVTGRAFNQEELQILFLLMEELGSAIKNTWLHRQLSSSHHLLADVLATLSSGCLVVDNELSVLHANRAMVQFIKGPSATERRLEFADLPPALTSPVYETVAKGVKAPPFFFTGGNQGESLFRATIIPFNSTSTTLPRSAMLVVEDFTQIEAAKKFEIEASKAKLISLIAKRFAHEIRNSLVPLTTHEQLLETEYQNEDFRHSLKTALSRETGRIQRFTEQMLYLAQPPRTANETVNLRDVFDSCFQRINGTSAPSGKIHMRSESELPLVRCHRAALEHAFQEIITNALQSCPDDPEVTVRIDVGPDGLLRLAIGDNGTGFSDETAQNAVEPFFTTKNTGVGLGLTVARKIIEDHHGQLHILTRSANEPYDIEVRLPAADSL